MPECVGGVYGIIKITFQRPSNVRAGWVHAKAVKTVYEIPEQLKILRKLNLIEDLEKISNNKYYQYNIHWYFFQYVS